MDFVQNDGFIGSLHKISYYSDEARVFVDVKVVDEDKESSRMLLRVTPNRDHAVANLKSYKTS